MRHSRNEVSSLFRKSSPIYYAFPTIHACPANDHLNSEEDIPLSAPPEPQLIVPSPLPNPPNLHGKSPRKFWNAVALAFLGDSVWEVRQSYGPLLLAQIMHLKYLFIKFIFKQHIHNLLCSSMLGGNSSIHRQGSRHTMHQL